MATQRKTIAVIDDDPHFLRAFERLLTAFGYQTLSFVSAAEFIHSPAGHGADCLLIDVHLGSGSGLELASHPLVTARNSPIIFMTAALDETVRRQALKLGIACLLKPFDSAELRAALSAAGI